VSVPHQKKKIHSKKWSTVLKRILCRARWLQIALIATACKLARPWTLISIFEEHTEFTIDGRKPGAFMHQLKVGRSKLRSFSTKQDLHYLERRRRGWHLERVFVSIVLFWIASRGRISKRQQQFPLRHKNWPIALAKWIKSREYSPGLDSDFLVKTCIREPKCSHKSQTHISSGDNNPARFLVETGVALERRFRVRHPRNSHSAPILPTYFARSH
jgi:hypothetical protein